MLDFYGQLISELSKLGIYAPVAFVVVQSAQILVFFVPGQILNVLGGSLFGATTATILSVVSHIIGSTALVSLTRRIKTRFGAPKCRNQRFELIAQFIEKRGLMIVFVTYLLPFFPDDTILFVSSLTDVPKRTLVVLFVVGRIPGILLYSMIGQGIVSDNSSSFWILFGLLSSVLFVAYLLLRKRIGLEL